MGTVKAKAREAKAPYEVAVGSKATTAAKAIWIAKATARQAKAGGQEVGASAKANEAKESASSKA